MNGTNNTIGFWGEGKSGENQGHKVPFCGKKNLNGIFNFICKVLLFLNDFINLKQKKTKC